LMAAKTSSGVWSTVNVAVKSCSFIVFLLTFGQASLLLAVTEG
jgi:hypothetical protein